MQKCRADHETGDPCDLEASELGEHSLWLDVAEL
jgi:hypothetical protein